MTGDRVRWAECLAALPQHLRQGARVLRAGFGPIAALIVLLQTMSVAAPARYRMEAGRLAAAAQLGLGVPIIWDLRHADPAPARDDDGTPIDLVPLRPEDASGAVRVVSDALSMFPADFAGRLLSGVFVVSALRYGGRPAGGMALGSMIYVVVHNPGDRANQAYARQIVYHESATVLLNRFTPDRAAWDRAWRDNNAPGFMYASDAGRDRGYDGDAPLTALSSNLAPDPALFASGLLSAYGTASIRADVDTFADALFITPDQLRGWMAHNPRIRHKVSQLQSLYRGADPRFSDVFDRLGIPMREP